MRAVKYISIITFPVMFGLSFCSLDFISIVYGEKWLAAAAPLRLLCFSAALASVHLITESVFHALGRPDIGFKWGAFKLFLTVSVVIFASRWGIIGIAGAMFFVEFTGIFMPYVATKLLKIKFIKHIDSLFPAFLSSSFMIIALYLVNSILIIENRYIRFGSNILVGITIYSLALFLMFNNEFKELIKFIKLSFNKK